MAVMPTLHSALGSDLSVDQEGILQVEPIVCCCQPYAGGQPPGLATLPDQRTS
jgi:hypothetical protein